MAKSRTERINTLTNQIDRWDTQIEKITSMRNEAVAEIAALLGLTSTGTKTASTTRTQPDGKLGDRILPILQADNEGRTREGLANRLNTDPQRVSLALYHLQNKGMVYEMDGKYHSSAPPQEQAAAKTSNES